MATVYSISDLSMTILIYTYVGRALIDENINLDQYAESQAEVNGLIFPDDFLTSADMSNYATKEYVNDAIAEIPTYTPISYSTTEQNTGIKWIDGKPIYQKTFNLTFTSNFLTVDLTALNIDSVVKIDGGVCDSSGGFIPFGYENVTSIYTSSATTMGVNNSYYDSRGSGYATIFYTKTTDTV